MKLRDIKEPGFYIEKDDLERKVVFEVYQNGDEKWLKEDPNATLILDTWIYDYKDENDRSIYFTDGNLSAIYLDETNIDVIKIEDTNYKVFGQYEHLLIEDKPTYKEQLQLKTEECKKKSCMIGNLGYRIKNQRKVINEKLKKIEELKKENEELNNRMAEVTHRATGGRLSYSNYTLEAIEQAFNDQLEILSERRVEEEISEIKSKCECYEKALETIKNIIMTLHYTTIQFHRGCTHELVDIIQEHKNEILDIIKSTKDGE